jgi:colicin import membrane protein
MSDTATNEVEPNFKGTAPPPAKKAGSKAPAAKKGAAAKKAPAAKKAASNINRTASTVSKEGTKKDEFTGEVLPVTAFPTVRGKDGMFSERGPVARKNLEAYRASRKVEKAAADKAKAEKKAAAAKAKADKAAAKESGE